jgi:hypothetical protein
MNRLETTDRPSEFTKQDLRDLALILDYASEQAQKLALAETIDLIARASRSLDMSLSEKGASRAKALPVEFAGDVSLVNAKPDAWQTPEFVGGPIILDDVA